jgi:hypothetical protein
MVRSCALREQTGGKGDDYWAKVPDITNRPVTGAKVLAQYHS